MTKEELKVILNMTVQTLREVSMQAFYAHEKTWILYGALMKSIPDFPEKYRNAAPDLAELNRLRDDINAKLAEIDARFH